MAGQYVNGVYVRDPPAALPKAVGGPGAVGQQIYPVDASGKTRATPGAATSAGGIPTTGSTTGGTSSLVDTIKGIFGGAGAGAGSGALTSAAPAAAPAAPSVNTAQADPDVSWALGQMKTRYAGDMGAGRAIDMASSKIRDTATGLGREMAAGRTSRGVSGTGVDDLQASRLAGQTQRAVAGSAADITQGREAAREGILQNVVGAGATQANITGAQQDRALRQWETVAAQQRQAEDSRQARELAVLNMLSNLSFA